MNCCCFNANSALCHTASGISERSGNTDSSGGRGAAGVAVAEADGCALLSREAAGEATRVGDNGLDCGMLELDGTATEVACLPYADFGCAGGCMTGDCCFGSCSMSRWSNGDVGARFAKRSQQSAATVTRGVMVIDDVL